MTTTWKHRTAEGIAGWATVGATVAAYDLWALRGGHETLSSAYAGPPPRGSGGAPGDRCGAAGPPLALATSRAPVSGRYPKPGRNADGRYAGRMVRRG